MSAITMYVTIRSLPHLTNQAFHDHWRHPHGTWGRQIENIVGYVQNHRIDTPHLGEDQKALDGVVEVGFEAQADVATMATDPAYLRFLKPDEPNFVENTGLAFLKDEVLQSGQHRSDEATRGGWAWREAEQPVSIRFIQVIKAGDPQAWRGADDLSLGQAIGAMRHVRSTPCQKLNPAADENAIIGIRQLWWPTLTAFEKGIAQNEAAWRMLSEGHGHRYAGVFQAERFI